MTKLLKPTVAALLLTSLAVRAMQPLVTDDTGTQGAGRWQIEWSFEQAQAQGAADRQRQWTATLTHGLTESLDLHLDAPHAHPGNFGADWHDAGLELKWRFLERERFSLAVKSELSLPTGDWRRGTGTGRTDASATLLAQWDAEPLTLLAGAGWAFQPNRRGDRQVVWQLSGAALYRVTGQLQLALDAVVARNATPGAGTPPAFLMAAAIYSPRPWLDLDIGYRYGINRQTDHHTVQVGVTARW